MKYLSELFLDNLHNDFSKKSVNNAIKICYNEYNSRIISSEELRDFLDVTKEFIYKNTKPDKYVYVLNCFSMIICPKVNIID